MSSPTTRGRSPKAPARGRSWSDHGILAFVTHRSEFSRGFTGPLRPGLLVAVTDDGQDYAILFLHLKAAGAPIDFGVRAHQHDKARSLRRALDSVAADSRANFIVAGDLNNVGLNLTYSSRDIDERSRVQPGYESHHSVSAFDRASVAWW